MAKTTSTTLTAEQIQEYLSLKSAQNTREATAKAKLDAETVARGPHMVLRDADNNGVKTISTLVVRTGDRIKRDGMNAGKESELKDPANGFSYSLSADRWASVLNVLFHNVDQADVDKLVDQSEFALWVKAYRSEDGIWSY